MRVADKSLALTYFLMSQDGIDSVVGKRGLFMCRIASLFFLQRLKGSMSGTRAISTTSKCELSSGFFFSCKARHRRKFTPF